MFAFIDSNVGHQFATQWLPDRRIWLLIVLGLIASGCGDESSTSSPISSVRAVAEASAEPSKSETLVGDLLEETDRVVEVEIRGPDGRTRTVSGPTMVAFHELVKTLKAEGATDGEVDEGVLLIDDEPVRLKDVVAAIRAKATAAEAAFAAIRYTKTPGERGYGGVLTSGKVPRKVLAKNAGIYLQDAKGTPLREMKLAMPYFVFEENETHLLVGIEQDRDLAIGWAKQDSCFAWPSRRLAYPTDAAKFTSEELRETSERTLPSFTAETVMPWPVLYEDRAAGNVTVLADLRSIGGEVLPMTFTATDKLTLYVLFTEKELNRLAAELTELVGFLESGRLSTTKIVQALGDFLTQNKIDFLDFDELQSVVELYPGGKPSFLLETEIDRRIRKLLPKLNTDIRDLTHVLNAREYFNGARGMYVIPLGVLGKTGSLR